MTQTGGLTVLLAWTIFGVFLAILAYLLLREEKDPLEDAATPTADQLAPPSGSSSHSEQPGS